MTKEINERLPQEGWGYLTNDPTWPKGDEKDAEIERLKVEIERLENKVVQLSSEVMRRHHHNP